MRLSVLTLISALLAGCSAQSHPQATTPAPQAVVADPIDQLVARLSATHGMWENGIFSDLVMPQTASPEEVIKARLNMGMPIGNEAQYKILKIRQVHIPIAEIGSDLCTAALIQTDSGEKIVLLRYIGPAAGWWNRIYDI